MPTSSLAAGNYLVKHRLSGIEDAAEFAERSIERRLDKIRSDFDEVSQDQSLSEDVRRELEDVYSDRARRFRSTYRHHLRNSLFLTAYSQFEVDLDWTAHVLRSKTNTSRRPSDLSDKGIERSQTYIKEDLELPFPDEGGSAWQTICGLKELRNAVAHGRNELDDPNGNDKNAWRVVNNWDSIEVVSETEFGETHHYFVLRAEFVPDVVETMGQFWDDLFDGLSRTSLT